jgi:hypothetical protein
MAVKDINDLYQQLSADENFSGLFSSPEEFADTMQSMSSDRQQAFYDKLVSGTQISNVDFTNALKKKDEASSTFESLSVGSKPNEPIEKVTIQMPEPPMEGLASQGIDLGLEPPVDPGYGKGLPVDPKQKVKNAIIGITNEMNNNPTGNWSQQYQELLKDPDYQKYKFSGDIQNEFKNIGGEWERLSKDNAELKQIGEQAGLAPKLNPTLPPVSKSVVLKKPETLYGRAYADSVAAEKRKKDQLGQRTEPMFLESDNTRVQTLDPTKLVEGEAFTQSEIKKVKEDPSSLYNAIDNKKLKYFTPQGQEIPFDEFALGSLLFNHTRLELQDKNGPVDVADLSAGENRKEGMSFMDEETFKKILVQNGFPKYKIDDEVERLKSLYLQQQSANEINENKNRLLAESGGNQAVANVKFLNIYEEKGRELLSDDENDAYALVKRIESLYSKVAQAQKAGGSLSSAGYLNGVNITESQKQIKSLQNQLSALRDNPNNLYDWKTGEFVDTRIATNKPKAAAIQKENAEFQIQYANTPKGDLTRMRNTLMAQREVIARKMSEDGIEVPEAGTFGSFVAKLQTSAARAGGDYSITLPNGLSMNSAQYEKKIKEYQTQLFDVEKNLYGINRALMLNENVLLKDEADGVFSKLGQGVVTAAKSIGREFIPGASEGDSKADWEVRNSLLMLGENGYVISPELKSLARKSVGEQIFDSAGMLVDAMAQIAIGNIAIPEITAMRWAKGMSASMKSKYGRVGEAVFNNTADAVRQGTIFQVAGQGFATGIGESLGQLAYDAMKLDRLFVNKGRLLPYLTRSILGGTAETIQEYAGQYLQVVSENGIDAAGNFKKAFGHDIESGLDQLMVIGITSTMFSGAANLKILTATESTLRNILDNPQAAAAYGDVLDEDKKKEIEEVLKVVSDKIHDRQSQKLNQTTATEKSDSYQEPLDAVTRTNEISALEEKRKEDLQKAYETNPANTDEEKQQLNEQVDAINQKYDDQITSLVPKSVEFESLTGRNLSAVVAGSSMNSPQVIEFLSNITAERNRKAAAEMIAIAQKANNTLKSVLPEATIIMHDKKSFSDKMKQRGLPEDRKANFSIHKGADGTVSIEIQINAEDGSFEDIAHEVTHGLLFNKFYDNEGRTQEINDAKDAITGTPKELTDKIAEINDKYDNKFSETLNQFREGLKKIATDAQSKYLEKFVENYDENSAGEEFITEFTAIITANGERIQQEDPTLFERLLALFNKLVSNIGSQAGIKLQKFKDTQEIIDFMNNVSTALREGKGLEGVKTSQKAPSVSEEVNLEDKARKEPEYKVVYHGGNIKGPQDNLYVAADQNQAEAYAKGNQGQVSKFNIDTKSLASEDIVRKAIEDLGLSPREEGYVAEDLNLHELIDNRFESALPDNEIEALKNKLKEDGYTGISFKDEDILGNTKEGVDNFLIFDKKDLVENLPEKKVKAEPAPERKSLGLKPEEEKLVYNIVDDENGSLYEQENLNITGSYSVPPKASGRFIDKARIDYTQDFEVDGIQMRAVKYISPLTSRNKKYNATMSDHTKVGSYVNSRTGTVVDNLYGGFLFSYIAENYDNGVVWASTTAAKARELIMNSRYQDKTVIYRMNRKSGSNGNDNFATIGIKELFAPLERGLVSEEEMLDLLNKRMSSVSLGKEVMSQGYSTGEVIGKASVVRKGETKELTMKAFTSIDEFKQAFLGGGVKEKLPFATRGPLWSKLLMPEADTKPGIDYYRQLEKWGVPRVPEIVDLIAEPVTDNAADADIIAALQIDKPEMVDIMEDGKKKKVAKVWTPFEELVDNEKGIFLTKGVKHTSYPYVVKGTPLGAYTEFHSVLDYFPVIKDWMTRTKESEGFLNRQEVMEKNADAIRKAQMDLDQAKIALDEIMGSKDVPKDIKESIKKEFNEYQKKFNAATRFEPRLPSSYKAIETMHGELMRNFDSTAKLIPTDRRPLANGVLPMEDKGRIEPWSTPQQEITSAGTSINKAKLPGVYSDKAFFNILRNTPGDKITIVDVGSGKYANMNIKPLLERGEVSDLITEGSQIKLKETAVPTIQEIIASKEIVYLPYDPFNQPASVNESTVSQVKGGKANIGISPNVLNVIAEVEAREGVIANLADAVGDTGTAIIQIYEGDPKDKGNGKITKTGGEQSWQNNQPTSWYIPEVKKYFANVKFANKIIIADNKVFEDKARISDKALEAKEYGVPQRYKGDVGKFIGGDLYVHKSAMDVLPQKEMEMAESKLPEDFEYEIVKYNAAQGSFSFIASPDWNTAKEPIVGDAYKVSRNGDVGVTKQKADPQIYHHKWNFVRDNYDGFDVRQSIQRSIDWYRDAKDDVNMYKIGTQSYWNNNAVPLINNTILNLQDKARKQDDIQNDYLKHKKKDPFATPTDLGNNLLSKGYSLGEIKRFIPELSEFYQKEAVAKFVRAIRSTQGKIRQRQDAIRQELAKNSNLSYTSVYDLLRKDYQDFELYKAFYEEGADPRELDDLFGTDYRQTIQKVMNQTQDGKTVYSPDLLREIRDDARSRKMVNIADQMKEVFTQLGDIVNAENIINMAADSLEEGFIESAMQEVTDDMRRRRQEMKDDVETLNKISKGDLKPGTVVDVSRLLSIAGRILQTGRGLTETQEGLEKLIFNSLEIVEYRPGKNVIRKQKVFKLTDFQKEKIRNAIKEYKKSKDGFKAATLALEEGLDMYTDEAFNNFDNAKREFEKQARQLKITISAFKKVGFGNWFTSMTALGLLSLRTLTVGIVGNVEMMLANMPKNTTLGKIFGWGRILSDKLVKSASQTGSKTNINEFVARGTGVGVDPSLYRKMAFEQGKQQIINIFENTVSDVSTSNNAFIDNQAIIDSNQDLKKSIKMFGKLLQNLLPKDKELKKEDWANAFDKLLLQMNEKDEKGNYKLEQQNPRGYQFAATFLRGIFGSIPTGTGKMIALSGDRVFFKYGYYQALVAYANSQGITDPKEVQRFIRLNSIPGTNADAMARRAGDRRIFQSDNKLVGALAGMRSKIKEAEANLDAQIAVLKTQKRGLERFYRVYPAKMTRLGYKVAATVISPFTRIPSNFINTAVQKTVFPISLGDYIIKQGRLRELVKRYDETFNLDKNASISKTKQREMEAMRLEIFELQTRTQAALSNTLQAMQVAAFGLLLLKSGAASAPYGDDEDEKARARAAGIAQQPSGSINMTHFFEWATGQANRYRVNKKGDIMFNYTNFGIVGFGLSEFMSLFQGIASKEFEGKKVLGTGEDGYSNASWDLVFESLSNGVANLSFIQNVVALGNAVRGQGNSVENLGVSLAKTLLTVPTLSYGVFGAVERAEGITVDPMRNYMPELETDEAPMNRAKARIVTSLTGKSPLTWFGLKDEMGEFKSPFASPYYRAQIGPHGEELYKKNTFWDVRGGDWLGAYLQASFDPFSFHDYEGFVSTVRKFEVGQQYRKGDIVEGASGVYAVMKDNKGLDLKDANKDPNDPEFVFIESKEKYFDRDRFVANQRGTEYSQTLFDLMSVYQQVTGDNKPYKVMSRLYDPYIKAKDAEGEFNVYIPEKYFRELAMARGEAARNAYSMESMRATLDRIFRAEDEDLFETDEEYKKFVKDQVEDLLLGPADTNYMRDGGIQMGINKAVQALENSEAYKKITRLALIEGLKNEVFTEEEYNRMVNAEGLSPYIIGIPESELKFRK